MLGLVALVSGVAVVAGLCAFLIAYDEALHRFPRRRALREGVRTGLSAGAFFAALGAILIAFLFH
jgi:hypothetical protein